MVYERLFIWVEGRDDERFVETVLKPSFQNKYDWVEVRPYAGMKDMKIDAFLKNIKAMGADYIFLADIDDASCPTEKKRRLQKKFRNVDAKKIITVIKEIESWYLAGLSNPRMKSFKMPVLSNTDDVTKEQFDTLIPQKFDSRIDFMIEILKQYSVNVAKHKNKSFSYIVRKQHI